MSARDSHDKCILKYMQHCCCARQPTHNFFFTDVIFCTLNQLSCVVIRKKMPSSEILGMHQLFETCWASVAFSLLSLQNFSSISQTEREAKKKIKRSIDFSSVDTHKTRWNSSKSHEPTALNYFSNAENNKLAQTTQSARVWEKKRATEMTKKKKKRWLKSCIFIWIS